MCYLPDVISSIIVDSLMKTQTIKFDVEDVGPIEIDVSEKTFEKVIEYFKKFQ